MIGRLIMKRLLSAFAMLAIALAFGSETLGAKLQPYPPCGLQPTKEGMKCLNDKLKEAQTKIGELQKDDADVRKEFDAKLKQAIEDMKAKLEREIADRKQADTDLGRKISEAADPETLKACVIGFARYKSGTDMDKEVSDSLPATLVAVPSTWTIEDCRKLATTLAHQSGMTIRGFKPACIFREAGADPKISLGVGIPDDIGGAWSVNWWPLYLSEAKPFNKGFTPGPNCGW
jgi:hypothetical protein